MSDLLSPAFSAKLQSQLDSCSYYQRLRSYPKTQQRLILGAVFLLSQLLIFGSLYLFIGEVAALGFFICILSGLATGVGAIPAIFCKKISTNIFNGLLGAAAGIMLAATAFSLLFVPKTK